MGLRKHELQCTAVGKWLDEIASNWTPVLQFLQHLFKIPYWDTEQNVCGWISGTSPSKRPNAISHLCLLVLCTNVSCAVIAVYVYFGCSEFCFSPVSICIVFSCLHCALLNLGARNHCSTGTHQMEGWKREWDGESYEKGKELTSTKGSKML